MALFSRRRLPDAVRSRLDLRPGDAVLVSTELIDERWVVASRLALHVLDVGQDVARYPWSDVDHGAMDPTTRTLSVRWVWGRTNRLVFTDAPGSTAFAQQGTELRVGIEAREAGPGDLALRIDERADAGVADESELEVVQRVSWPAGDRERMRA